MDMGKSVRASACVFIAFLISQQARAQSEEWTANERAREHFLCSWNAAHELLRSDRTLDFCVDPEAPIGLSLVQQDGFWADQLKSTKMQFEADFQGSPELQQAASARKRAEEDERLAAAQREKDARAARIASARKAELAREAAAQDAQRKFDASAGSMGVYDLCDGFREHRYASATAELERRKAFKDDEMLLIMNGQVSIGMSERALLCSWGRTTANRTITATIEHIQYVYSPRSYVYVTNGRVTSIQDTR